jgi:hypothetical protein
MVQTGKDYGMTVACKQTTQLCCKNFGTPVLPFRYQLYYFDMLRFN